MGIDRSAAVKLALAHSESVTPSVVVSATLGTFHQFEPGAITNIAQPDQQVWKVVLRGDFPFEHCLGESDGTKSPCGTSLPTNFFLIDFATGHVISHGYRVGP